MDFSVSVQKVRLCMDVPTADDLNGTQVDDL